MLAEFRTTLSRTLFTWPQEGTIREEVISQLGIRLTTLSPNEPPPLWSLYRKTRTRLAHGRRLWFGLVAFTLTLLDD